MSDESTETPPKKLQSFLEEKLQEGFNQASAGIGAQIVTDWLVIAEVHNSDGPVLRLIDSGMPLWRQVGLLKFALMDAEQDLLALNTHHDDDEES
jgi:hypothetical protein